MNSITAIISLLHHGAPAPASQRLFRGEPVLAWTLRRLRRCAELSNIALLCWEDQVAQVRPLANDAQAFILAKGPRCAMPLMDAINAAQRWAGGWRGGLMNTSCFDGGFHPAWMGEIARQFQSDAVMLVDSDAGLVDPAILSGMIQHARKHESIHYSFTPAAPGLGGVLLRAATLDRMAEAKAWIGQLLSYHPDMPGRDPIGNEPCAPVPASIARTVHRFTLDSHRQIHRIEGATTSLNGQLQHTEAEQLVARLAAIGPDPLPRDIVLEINTTRRTRPVFSPSAHLAINRPDMTLDAARKLFGQLASMDDLRLTLGGAGDPLLSPAVNDIVNEAHASGIAAIQIQTDLSGLSASELAALVDLPVDVITVYLPATTAETYKMVMGIDGFDQVMANIGQFLSLRKHKGRLMPLLVPVFHKCRENLHEMEQWYDHWLRLIGCAAIVGPSDYAGQMPPAAVADMSPPQRVPCRRLASRLSILSDGQIVACEQDVLGLHPLGDLAKDRVQDAWAALAEQRRCGSCEIHALCANCREWHRP
jgi:hypothetical protein